MIDDEDDPLYIYEAFFILVLLFLSLSLEIYDNKLRCNELPNRVKVLLDKIQKKTLNIDWKSSNYPNLYSPYSPCITLQWTYRDNKIVNLPWALLVKDDVILIRPGQISPGYCESLDKTSEYPLLHAKEVYGPSLQNHNEMFSAPKARRPLESRKYKLLETPYTSNLRLAIEQALDKPITQQNRQRHLLMIRFVERLLLPITILVVFVLNFIRFFYLDDFFGEVSLLGLFVLAPLGAALPLLPLVFPVIWYTLNYLGMAR